MVFWVIINFTEPLSTSHYGSRLVSVKTNNITTRMLHIQGPNAKAIKKKLEMF